MKKLIYSGAGLLLIAVAFLAFNLLAGLGLGGARLDLTEQKLYTISEGTERILEGLQSPIELHFFYSDETAKDVYRALAGKNLLRGPEAPEPRHDFASTGDPEAFSVLARRFLGPEVTAVEHVAFAPGAAGAPAGPPHPPSPPTSHQGSA